VHKRLWELKGQAKDLGEAIGGYERGFYLKQDWYNGINLAFLLDLRALESLKAGNKDEAVADTVQAKRVRRDVIRYATPMLEQDSGDPKKRFWWSLPCGKLRSAWATAPRPRAGTQKRKRSSCPRGCRKPGWSKVTNCRNSNTTTPR